MWRAILKLRICYRHNPVHDWQASSFVQTVDEKFFFVQADATFLPVKDNAFDSVFMMGGIHHVKNRDKLFSEIYRILKPGGRFYWREPLNDFFLWKYLRNIIYRFSSSLDEQVEEPLEYSLTKAQIERAGLNMNKWHRCGLFGFCLFMNSDILVFNRLFNFVPGIEAIVKRVIRFDEFLLRFRILNRLGFLVVGAANKN